MFLDSQFKTSERHAIFLLGNKNQNSVHLVLLQVLKK